MHVLNVLIRIALIVAGIIIALGVWPAQNAPSPFREVFGVVVALFGVLRLLLYRAARSRNKSQ